MRVHAEINPSRVSSFPRPASTFTHRARDHSNFRRKVTRAEHFLEPNGERRRPEIGRPAALYRRGTARVLFPPLLRFGDVARARFTSTTLR